jgi:hypothetical protein
MTDESKAKAPKPPAAGKSKARAPKPPAAGKGKARAPKPPAADAEEAVRESVVEEEAGGPHAGRAAERPTDESAEQRRPLTDEERAELYKQQLKELRLLDVARDVMLTLVTVGYQKLGLTGETSELRDLGEAHLAIELLRGIIGAIEGVAGADEIETYRSTLAQMQMNFARVSAET